MTFAFLSNIGCLGSKCVLVDLSVFHDDPEILGAGDQRDVSQRIAVSQQKGELLRISLNAFRRRLVEKDKYKGIAWL
jgi:hypothetical protein